LVVQGLSAKLAPKQLESRAGGSKAKREAVAQIDAIMEDASFHKESLAALAEMAGEAQWNQQRIVKAAELASKFGYHTGALLKVAEMAAATEHECAALDEVLELVVLKLSETPKVIKLAQDAVDAKNADEVAAIQHRIRIMRQGADYQTLEEALTGQAKLFGSAKRVTRMTSK
jgi:hypothetical protein